MDDYRIEKISGKSFNLIFGAKLTGAQVERIEKDIFKVLKDGDLTVDLSDVEEIDTTGMGFIAALRRNAEASGASFEIVRVSEKISETLSRFLWMESPAPQKKSFDIPDALDRLGGKVFKLAKSGMAYLYLLADTLFYCFGGAARTQRVRKGAVIYESYVIGVQALGIVSLIGFLIGTVLSIQSASQLRLFGADILIADAIAISMTNEIGPLMTAILMAGRSGASIAAQIATMQINEEIAGLRTMGLEPVKYVVVPKFRAITLTMPALSIFTTLCGIFGGFLIGVLMMGIGPTAFWIAVFSSIDVTDVSRNIIKSVAFAWIIVTVSAHQGFQAYGGSESVGRVTTNSVVQSIFWCIVADAVFSFIFY